MLTDERVDRLVGEQFLPVMLNVKDDAANFKTYQERYGELWTPTLLLLDAQGQERHRIEGSLPADDFLAQLTLGLAQLALRAELWENAERWFQKVLDEFPTSEAAPEALYWLGVARYKGRDDKNALTETARAFEQRYQDSSWAKKASVWRKREEPIGSATASAAG